MSVEATQADGLSEAQAMAEISSDGFAAEVKDYPAGNTEPHRHDYDVCLHILSGDLHLGLAEEVAVRSLGPGDRLVVRAGTLHSEDHGPLRMVVGRRRPEDSRLSSGAR